jgi:hypothetical protein
MDVTACGDRIGDADHAAGGCRPEKTERLA